MIRQRYKINRSSEITSAVYQTRKITTRKEKFLIISSNSYYSSDISFILLPHRQTNPAFISLLNPKKKI